MYEDIQEQIKNVINTALDVIYSMKETKLYWRYTIQLYNLYFYDKFPQMPEKIHNIYSNYVVALTKYTDTLEEHPIDLIFSNMIDTQDSIMQIITEMFWLNLYIVYNEYKERLTWSEYSNICKKLIKLSYKRVNMLQTFPSYKNFNKLCLFNQT